jgi:hypothetical protein
MKWMDKAFLAKYDEEENTIEKLIPYGTEKYFFEDELAQIEDDLQEKFDKSELNKDQVLQVLKVE